MQKIYLLYNHLCADEVDDVPGLNWHLPGMDFPSELHMGLCYDPRFEYLEASKVTADMQWLYELNYFYTSEDFTPDWPALDVLASNDLLRQGLHQGNGRLLINLSQESFIPQPASRLIEYVRSRHIPDHAVIFGTGAVNASEVLPAQGLIYQALLMRTCESRSCMWAKKGQQHQLLRSDISRRFLCFNRRFRPHRFQLLAMLEQQRLLDHFYISFGRSVEGLDARESVRHQCQSLPDGDHIIKTIDDLYDRLPFHLDKTDMDVNLVQFHANDDVSDLYLRTGISVVTDTAFHSDAIFPTEKAFHPIRYCQPFIIVGSAGTLRTMRNDGYRTFDSWWDESYDTITDHHTRMAAIVAVIAGIAAWSDQTFAEFLVDSWDICLHNLNLLKSCHARPEYTDAARKLFD
jgi:hypothetical protein